MMDLADGDMQVLKKSKDMKDKMKNKWKNIRDELPPEGEPVLTYCSHDKTFRVDYLMNLGETEDFIDSYCFANTYADDYKNVTHWIELPNPPEE